VLTTSVGIAVPLMVVAYPNENWYTCPQDTASPWVVAISLTI